MRFIASHEISPPLYGRHRQLYFTFDIEVATVRCNFTAARRELGFRMRQPPFAAPSETPHAGLSRRSAPQLLDTIIDDRRRRNALTHHMLGIRPRYRAQVSPTRASAYRRRGASI